MRCSLIRLALGLELGPLAWEADRLLIEPWESTEQASGYMGCGSPVGGVKAWVAVIPGRKRLTTLV